MTQIKEMMIPRGTAARPGYAMTPKFITIHNTANENKGAGALSHGTYMTTGGGKNVTTSYHYVVDDSLIVRLLPDNEAAWHAGDGSGTKSGNRTSLAIEICENPESDLTKATDNAAELTARLMKDWGIGLSNVKQHNYWSGKDCPRKIRAGKPYSWEVFAAKVQAFRDALDKPEASIDTTGTLWTVQTAAFSKKANANAYHQVLTGKGIPCFVKYEDGWYRVQCGAFCKKENAENYASTLAVRGVEALVKAK